MLQVMGTASHDMVETFVNMMRRVSYHYYAAMMADMPGDVYQ
jgi:hypothetical protein